MISYQLVTVSSINYCEHFYPFYFATEFFKSKFTHSNINFSITINYVTQMQMHVSFKCCNHESVSVVECDKSKRDFLQSRCLLQGLIKVTDRNIVKFVTSSCDVSRRVIQFDINVKVRCKHLGKFLDGVFHFAVLLFTIDPIFFISCTLLLSVTFHCFTS